MKPTLRLRWIYSGASLAGLLLLWMTGLNIASCTTQRKLSRLRSESLTAGLIPGLDAPVETGDSSSGFVQGALQGGRQRDTLVVEDPEGRQLILMKAVREEESGELVASEVLDAAYVSAPFKSVAERRGKVDIRFMIRVPALMQDKGWQLRFYPELVVLEDSLALEPVIITGLSYRKRQLRGYEQYRRFLSRIISDTTRFIDMGQLEVFIRRNLPAVYRFKTDSSFVSDEEFSSFYGVTEQEALTHYTRNLMIRRNENRKARSSEMFRRYVKVPIEAEGIRLDTVIRGEDGSFSYEYVETIRTRPRLRKVEILLSGQLYEEDRLLYTIPQADPLTIYISSLSALLEDRERYVTRIVERRAEAHTACYIAFEQGRSLILPGLGHNREEIRRIKENLIAIEDDQEFDLDSMVVSATCSPEGGWRANALLAQQRAESVSRYFSAFADSLRREAGFSVDLDGRIVRKPRAPVRFLSRSEAENWSLLDILVQQDPTLGERAKAEYRSLRETEPDPDRREQAFAGKDWYRYLREQLYPRLRVVRFDFYLARKGMVRDTIHTTEPDTVYRQGLQAIRDRDYARAVSLLAPYRDYNSAVACCAAERNATAMEILSELPQTDKTLYLQAILNSRLGDEQTAVQCYLHACRLNGALVHRGSLDPEIATLIKAFDLMPLLQQPEPELDW